MKAELLRVEAVTVTRQGHGILKNLHLALRTGGALGIHSAQAVAKRAVVDVVSGVQEADTGRIYLDGVPCLPEADPRRRQTRVAVIRSSEAMVEALSVAENIFVIRRGLRTWRINRALIEEQTRYLMKELGLPLHPGTPVSRLNRLERCLLQGAKAYALGARLVVLQDLSSFLPDEEIARMQELMAQLRQLGLGILTVDSDPKVLAALAEEVVLLRQGEVRWSLDRDECLLEKNRRCFEGLDSDRDSSSGAVTDPKPGDVVLAFDRVALGESAALSFQVRTGQGLCLLDRGGTGIETIRQYLCGEARPRSGQIRTAAGALPHGSAKALAAARIAIIPENPGETMLFPHMTALENLCYPLGAKMPGFWLTQRYRQSCRREYEPLFSPEDLDRYPDQLPLSDRHRLAYLRWHLFNPALVVCVRPFSSVDPVLNSISAECLRLLLQKGIAVLVLSSNDSAEDPDFPRIEVPKNDPLHPKDAL